MSDSRKKPGSGDSWMQGLEPVEIMVTPGTKDKLARMAKKSRMGVSEVASVVFQEQFDKYVTLEQSIEEAVSRSVGRENDRLEENIKAIVSPLEESNRAILDLLPLLKKKIKKDATN